MRNRWTMLAVLFLARTAMSVQFQSVGSLSPFLVPDLGLDYAALGTLIGLYMLPGLVIALPGGVLGRRFGETRMCLLGLALMTLGGLLMGLAETYALATIGGVIINVLLTKMVADWFAGPEMMTAMALFVISWPVGIGLGLLTLGPLAATTGWPLVMHVTAAICAISLVLVALCYRPPAGAAKPTGAGSLASMFRLGFTGRGLALVLLAGTLWSLFNVSFILVVSFAPDFLTAAGHSQTDAGAVVSIATWLTVIMGPVGGLLAERSGRPGMILAVSLTRFGAAVAAMTPAAPADECGARKGTSAL